MKLIDILAGVDCPDCKADEGQVCIELPGEKGHTHVLYENIVEHHMSHIHLGRFNAILKLLNREPISELPKTLLSADSSDDLQPNGAPDAIM